MKPEDCVDWFRHIGFHVLHQHTLFNPLFHEEGFQDFVRDGSQLCYLLNFIDVRSLDLQLVSPDCVNSESRSLANAQVFLESCFSYFDVESKYLFQPDDPYNRTNLEKIIGTLRALSQTRRYKLSMQEKGRTPYELKLSPVNRPFPQNGKAEYDHADGYDPYIASAYVPMESNNVDAEEIYGTMVDKYLESTPNYAIPNEVNLDNLGLSLKNPAVKELVNKEKAFARLVCDVITLYKDKLTANTFLREHFMPVFCGNLFENMKELHIQLVTDICSPTFQSEYAAVCKAFKTHRKKIAEVYGRYFIEFNGAIAKLDELLNANQIFVQEFEKIKQNADSQSPCSQFDLRSVMHIPFQHVLKYHLFIEKLQEQAENERRVDLADVQKTLEIVRDIGSHLNECKRDMECIEFVKNTFTGDLAIVPLVSNPRALGKFLKESVFHKIKIDKETWTNEVKVYLFQRGIICTAQNGRYRVLANQKFTYRTEEKQRDKPFIRIEFATGCVVKIAMKNPFLCKEWEEMLSLVSACLSGDKGQHKFALTTFTEVTECAYCGKILKGSENQGLRCERNCKMAIHVSCLKDLPVNIECTNVQPLERNATSYIDPLTASGSTVDLQAIANWNTAASGSRRVSDVSNYNETRWQNYEPPDTIRRNYSESQAVSRDSAQFATTTRRKVSLPQTTGEPLARYDWFCPVANRNASYRICSQLPNNTFLVRRSEGDVTGGAIMIKFKDDVQNLKIYFDKNRSEFYISKEQFFDSIPSLVTHFRQNSLENSFPAIKTRLICPFQDGLMAMYRSLDNNVYASLAFLRSNFTANVERDQLSEILRGELVMVKRREHHVTSKVYVDALVESGRGAYKRCELIIPKTLLRDIFE